MTVVIRIGIVTVTRMTGEDIIVIAAIGTMTLQTTKTRTVTVTVTANDAGVTEMRKNMTPGQGIWTIIITTTTELSENASPCLRLSERKSVEITIPLWLNVLIEYLSVASNDSNGRGFFFFLSFSFIRYILSVTTYHTSSIKTGRFSDAFWIYKHKIKYILVQIVPALFGTRPPYMIT